MRNLCLFVLQIGPAIIFIACLPFLIIAVRAQRIAAPVKSPRFMFGPNSLINNKYWAQAMKTHGYVSKSWVWDYYESINKKNDYDKIFLSKTFGFDRIYMPFWAFAQAILNFDIFVQSFEGSFLGRSFLAGLEPYLFKIMGKKTILIPYGSDFYRYSGIEDTVRRHTLIADYPRMAKFEKSIQKSVDRWTLHADCIIVGFAIEKIGRWDCSVFSAVTVDAESVPDRDFFSDADGRNKAIKITHSPNHRTIKGTEFIIDTINKLKDKGYKIDFILLESVQNEEVINILKTSDILIEQLFSGYALSGAEGMAHGNVVISNLNREVYTRPFRLFSFLNECPVVSSSVEELEETLIQLITNPDLRKKLGRQGQQYCRKYHSYKSSHYLFSNIAKKIWHGEDINLFDLHHPLKSKYCQTDKIKTDLVKNKLPC